MATDFFVSAFVTLLVVVDPLGLAPTFLAVTSGLPQGLRTHIAARAPLIAGAVLIGAALFGGWLLTRLGISLPAFRIAGGLLLFSIASEMVLGLRTERQTRAAEQALEEHAHHLAAFPLAVPLLAGPGAITAAVLLAGQADGKAQWLALLLGAIIATVVVSAAVFFTAARIGRFIGAAANNVLSRLLGVLLAALAVQYVIDGIRATLRAA